MYPYLGDFELGKTIFFPFHTFNSSGASVTLTGLAVTDIEVYKNASMTQRSSDAGYSLVDTDGIDLDSVTGIHGFTIDTNDNTDAGFYAAGNDYTVVVSAVTVDSQTVNFIAGRFSLINRVNALSPFTLLGPYPHLGIVDSGTAQSATGNDIVIRAANSNADDTLIGTTIWVFGSTQGYWQEALITDSVLSSDTVTVTPNAGYVTPSGTITYIIFGTAAAAGGGTAPTAAENATAVLEKIIATHSGVSGSLAERLSRIPNVAPAANGGLPTVDASNRIAGIAGTINTLDALDTAQDSQHSTTQSRLPAALVSGRMDSSVGAMASNVLTATAINADAFTAAKFAADVGTEIAAAVLAAAITEPASVPAWASANVGNSLAYLFAKASNRQTETATVYTLRNRANSASIATSTNSDDGTTTVKGSDA
jgi:hypothetical protein